MSEQVVTYKDRTYSIMLLIIIGVLGVLLLWKTCGSEKEIDPQIAKRFEKSTKDSLELVNKVKAIRDSAKDIAGEKELADSMLSDAAKDLKKMFIENDRLRKQHAQEPAPIPFDSNSSIVSNEVIKQCDTCFLLNMRMEDSVKSAMKTIDKLGQIHQKQLDLKDKEIGVYQVAVNGRKKDYDELLRKYLRDTQPRATISGGIEYSYSRPVTNIGVYLMYRTKRGKEFSVSGGGSTLNAPYITGRLGMKIF